MASPKDVVLHQFQIGQTLLEMLIADLTDEEYFKPPIAGANHTAWILGHISQTEDWAVGLITGCAHRLSQSTHELFQGGSTCLPDSAKYPSRKEIDEMFRNSRAATTEALKAFDDGKWNDPSPEGAPQQFFPTLGSLWGLQGTHQFWHVGQLTVCRHAMNKKKVLM